MINGSGSVAPGGGFDRLPPTTSMPCPPWCGDSPGHAFNSSDRETGALVRIHTLRISDNVELYADELAVSDQGPIWQLQSPRIFIGPDLLSVGPDEATQLAADLTAAVAKIGKLS